MRQGRELSRNGLLFTRGWSRTYVFSPAQWLSSRPDSPRCLSGEASAVGEAAVGDWCFSV